MNETLALKMKALLMLYGHKAKVIKTNSSPPRFKVTYGDKTLYWNTKLDDLDFLQ